MKNLIMFLSAVAILTSCSKKNAGVGDDNNPPPVNTGDRIKTSTFDNGPETYTYDSKGRAVQSVNPSGKKTVYEYENGKTKVNYFGQGGNFLYTYIYELGANGRAARVTISNDPGYDELNEYNPDGTISKSTVKNGAETIVNNYFYSNGNCDSSRAFISGVYNSAVRYTYYTDKPNVLSNVQFGRDFSSKPNKNILKSIIYVGTDGTAGAPINSEYEFDAKGRVIKSTEILAGSGAPEVGTYTYFD